jgi:chromosome segregation ATPase
MFGISNQVNSGRRDSNLLYVHLKRLKSEYDKIISALDDKKQKLSKATRTLEELRELATESQKKAEEMRQHTEEYKIFHLVKYQNIVAK